ncbi:acyl-CoA desaturase [Pendulispora brunnea]|uniref:acyl-CoA desaturase n=1 Tax=Pendulispora brunnea TaxID=2905690 RepID=UPI00374DFFDC
MTLQAAGIESPAPVTEAAEDPSLSRIAWITSIPFFAVHVAAVAGVWALGWSWKGFLLAVGFYYLRMFGITAGNHRYFAHRTYKTSRVFQFVLAFIGTLSVQKGVLWWAAHHRLHHKFSDKPGDIHSRKLNGFLWSHVGWILARKYDETEWDQIRDFRAYPELVWLNRWHLVPITAFAVTLYLTLGWWGLVWGFFVSTSLLWHGTFTINSLAHWIGRRRYTTTDDSRNSLLLALITLGEGWHNNHHYYPKAVNQGFFWWEIDVTYYVLRVLSVFGIVWDLHTPPAKIRDRAPIASRAARVEG